jgi:hypothetical protein
MKYSRNHAQGWFCDPYRQHNARWFSDGSPTALVRDDGVESQDPPPTSPYTGQLEPVAETEGELLHSHLDGNRSGRGLGLSAIRDIFVSTGGD